MEYETKLSDIIASLSEVAGGFLYSPDKGVYANQTAGIAEDAELLQVSIKLTKIVSMLSVHFQDTGGIRICFKDLILFGTRIEGDHWLFLFHSPSLSPGMIKMTVQMALNIETEEPSSNQIPTTPSEDTGNEPALDTNNPIIDILLAPESELRETLLTMENQLAQRIGPVAGLVFKDSVEKWAANTIPSIESLPELIAMMEKEIDDEDDRNSFRASMTSLVEG